MGIHYVNRRYLARMASLICAKPEAVMYEPMPGGKLMLVADRITSRLRDRPHWKASCSASTAPRTSYGLDPFMSCMYGPGSRT